MPTVLIIGFSYDNLPSTIADIYHVYSYYKNLDYNLYICTDIIEPINIEDRISLLTSGSVDDKFISFVSKTFDCIKTVVKDKQSLIDWFRSIELSKDNRLIIYYTGHGIENNILLPNGDRLTSYQFRNHVLDIGDISNQPKSNIFIIIDCCNPHGFFLPFKFDRDSKSFTCTNFNFILPKIIVMTSSESDSLSQALRLESPFTKYLFEYISKGYNTYDIWSVCNSIDEEIEKQGKIKSGQKCAVYSSYHSLLVLWSWVINSVIDVEADLSLKTITINSDRLNEKTYGTKIQCRSFV